MPKISAKRLTFAGLLDDAHLATWARMCFQHDGASPHVYRAVIQRLNNSYLGRWIVRGGSINWPPRFPHLTPLHYGLWEGVDEKTVCGRNVNT